MQYVSAANRVNSTYIVTVKNDKYLVKNKSECYTDFIQKSVRSFEFDCISYAVKSQLLWLLFGQFWRLANDSQVINLTVFLQVTLEVFVKGFILRLQESSEKIYIDKDFPDEYASSESRIALKGAVAEAKANASCGIPKLIQIATNASYSENRRTNKIYYFFDKNASSACRGWEKIFI